MALYYMEKEEISSLEDDWSEEDETEQDSYAYEADYGESSWRDETCYVSDLGDEPDDEELEPEPPDRNTTPQAYHKPVDSWYEEDNDYDWQQGNAYTGSERDDYSDEYEPPAPVVKTKPPRSTQRISWSYISPSTFQATTKPENIKANQFLFQASNPGRQDTYT